MGRSVAPARSGAGRGCRLKRKAPREARAPEPRRWYLLIHQVPSEPLYLRAKIRQRLCRVGAVALKNSVYALPFRDDCLEDLEWIAQEAVSGGGEAHVCLAEFSDRETDNALVERSRSERTADYAALGKKIQEWNRKARRRSGARPPEDDLPATLARARRRLEEISRIDFFEAPGRPAALTLLDQLETRARTVESPSRSFLPSNLLGRTWATRRGVQVDRIASAWLIRRFLDPNAGFRFVDPKEPPREGELRFDMVGGDFSHEADACTLETLITRTGVSDPALRPLAEIVHDIDLKDGKFRRPEAPGVEQVLLGLLLACPRDEDRLDRGFALFDGLYESFRRGSLKKEVRK